MNIQGELKIYKDPLLPKEVLIGFKGYSKQSPGFFYAPYASTIDYMVTIGDSKWGFWFATSDPHSFFPIRFTELKGEYFEPDFSPSAIVVRRSQAGRQTQYLVQLNPLRIFHAKMDISSAYRKALASEEQAKEVMDALNVML